MKLLDAFFKNTDRRAAISWALYDFANSSYALLILGFVFPIYFREVIAGGGKGDFYWGLVLSVSIFIGGLLAPIVGAIADYDARKKPKFIAFALAAIAGTALLYFTGSDMLLLASLFFIVTNIAFELAQTLYDSFLARVSTRETAGRISGLAWGLGYIGGIAAMLALKPLYENGYAGDLELGYKLTFPLTALFFLIFAIPAFLFIKETKKARAEESLPVLIKHGIKRVIGTLKSLKNHKNIAWFLLGFYFLNDALVTLFSFTSIYARTTFGMEFNEIIMLLLLVQIIGFPAATIFGLLSDMRGSKKILLFTIAVWAFIVAFFALTTSKTFFYVLAFLVALVIGSSQAIARSWLSKLVPDEKRSEFFGFNGFASKIAATLGPVLFGTISTLTGSQRLAMAGLIPFFIIAFVIFARIDEEEIRILPPVE